MSGVLRLSNNVTGRSTIIASASNDQTFTLPAIGGTLLAGGSSLEVIFPSGTEALPGLHVQGDTDTGLYAPAANTLGISTAGSERLRIDSSGKVGIGTSSPGTIAQANANKLVLANTADVNARTGLSIISGNNGFGSIYIGDTDGTTRGYIEYAHGADALTFGANGGERLRIDSSGRLLVGTSSSTDDYLFQVDSSTFRTAQFTRYGSDGATIAIGSSRGTQAARTALNNNDYAGLVAFNGYDGSDFQTIARLSAQCDGQAPAPGDSPGRLVFSTTSDGASSPTERLRIDSSGNVGIGETSPAAGLDVKVDTNPVLAIDRGSANTANFNLQYNGTTTGQLSAANGDFQISAAGASTPISFYANGSERMRIDSSGNLSFSQEASSNYPEQKLKWSNDSTTTNGFYLSQDTNRNGKVWHEQGLDVLFGTNNTERMRIDSSGRLLVGTSSSLSVGEPGNALVQVIGRAGGATDVGRFAIARGEAATSITSSEEIGKIYFTDNAGNTFGQIECTADANAGSGDYPGRLVFSTTNGNVENTNNSYGAISDIKLKENIVDANSQWDDLKALQVRNYNFKEGQTHTKSV
jgi:hypothetical protein